MENKYILQKITIWIWCVTESKTNCLFPFDWFAYKQKKNRCLLLADGFGSITDLDISKILVVKGRPNLWQNFVRFVNYCIKMLSEKE